MLSSAIVPDYNVPGLPAVAIDELGPSDVISESADEGQCFVVIQSRNASAVVPHHVNSFAPSARMGTYNRVFDWWVLGDCFRADWSASFTTTEVEDTFQPIESVLHC